MENTAKYEFTGETRKINVKGIEYKVKRIKALKGFHPPTMLDEVNIGDYGGWIESENNLSHDGRCWVDEEAVVIGNAVVKDNAYVCGRALIRDNAVICEKATVDANAIVGGESLICENASISGNVAVYGYITVKGSVDIDNFVTLVNLNKSDKTVIDGTLFIDTSLLKKVKDVKICSRKIIEEHLFIGPPENTAVISFYDPDKFNNDKNYKLVDYNGKADHVLYIPLDDLQTELPEADKIAEFVYTAKSKDFEIICQCESGQNRSAGCAAAIQEHFYHSGDFILNNHRYHPDEMVYYAVLNALEAIDDNE